MNFRTATLTLLLTAAPSTLAAQDSQPAPAPAKAAHSIDDLIEQLGHDSYKKRRAATKALVELGQKAKDELEAAAEDHDDPEVRMRAERVLGKIERKAAANEDRAQDLAETLRGRLKPRGKRIIPPLRVDKFDNDQLRDMIDDMIKKQLPDHQRLIERQRELIEKLMKDLPGELDVRWRDDLGVPQAPGQRSSSSKISIEQGPDGVRVEVQSDDDGEGEAKVYEAPDMESFKKQYPDIAKQYFGGDGKRGLFRSGPEFRRGFTFEMPNEINMPNVTETAPYFTWRDLDTAEAAPAAPAKGRRLGVYVDDLAPAVADFLGFEKGEGLKVTSVADDSLASEMGVRENDVILEIGGKSIGSRADVATALGSIKAGEPVEVTVNRRGREVELEAKKRITAETASEAEAPKEPKTRKKLQRRKK